MKGLFWRPSSRPGCLGRRAERTFSYIPYIPQRHLCHCSVELVPKPATRLQRLFHSSQAVASLSNSAKDRANGHFSSLPAPSQREFEELKLLVNLLPPRLRGLLLDRPDLSQLLEVVLDLGRPPTARFSGEDVRLSADPVSFEDLAAAIAMVGDFGDDNRAGIDRTLHRISCIRNRDGAIVGLTCRVGRAISGCASLAADFAMAGKSLLIMGKPGVGKTTAIRELARLLADEVEKRVVLVDTSNEIGGDGDIPHRGVGKSRRMQVARTVEQHRVMIEAVENHMPEVIVIDEIGTEAEALAARTISQRGVQLIATAHGIHLENLIKNPSLQDLLGGIETVTLGDDEAKRRGTRKTVRERAAPPTFDVAIELLDRRRWCIYPNLAQAVDSLLLDKEPLAEIRDQDRLGEVVTQPASLARDARARSKLQPSRPSLQPSLPDSLPRLPAQGKRISRSQVAAVPVASPVQDRVVQPLYVFSVGLDHDSVLQALYALGQRGERLILTSGLQAADVVLAVRSQMRPGSWARDAARAANVPVYAVKNGNPTHLVKALETLLGLPPLASDTLSDSGSEDGKEEEDVEYQNHVVSMSVAHNESEALDEAQQAVEKVVLATMKPVELLPRSPEIVAKQTALISASYGFATQVIGKGMQSRIRILPSIGLSSSQGDDDEISPDAALCEADL